MPPLLSTLSSSPSRLYVISVVPSIRTLSPGMWATSGAWTLMLHSLQVGVVVVVVVVVVVTGRRGRARVSMVYRNLITGLVVAKGRWRRW